MKRRTFLGTTFAGATLAVLPIATSAAEFVNFTEKDEITAALGEGKTVVVVYAAQWCSTCAKQERVLNALRDENPSYDENLVFVRVDWDEYGRKPVTTDRKVPRRSTLLALKGDEEYGRLIASTSKGKIKEFLDTAQAAGTS